MSAAEKKAVFLSYASQDADAARRICDALRSAGVEVWFDQSELRGGDAWDAKIRKQIKECALFVPVISANTQARREGYFRLEWRLADQRSHLMGKTKTFLLPLCIDDTRDSDADVPDSFLTVQWTRLPGAECTDPFCARVKTLLDSAVSNADAANSSSSANPVRASHAPASARPHLVKASRWLIPSCAALVVLIAIALWWPRDGKRVTSVDPASSDTTTGGTTTTVPNNKRAPLSPARELVEKARVLYEPWDLATKDDFLMAEQFLKRAAELDPTDGEVWAAQTLVSCAFVAMSVTPEDRRVEMRLQAERALKLAPDSDNARFAWAYAVRLEGTREAWGQAEPILRDVVARHPDNRMILRGLGYPLASRTGTREEGLALLQRAAALPGGDAVAEFNIGQVHMYYGGSENLKAALAAYNRSLQLAPRAHRTHSGKLELLLSYAGDLTAARQAVREVPEIVLREDRVAAIAVRVLLAAGEPDEALRVLSSTYPYLNARFFAGPAAYLKGVAHRQAGRDSAAATEWNVALKEIQKRLDATPTARNELLFKAATLAHLGRRAEAADVLQLYEQLIPANARTDKRVLIVKAGLGRIPEVVAALEEDLRSDRTRGFMARTNTASFILFDPELAPLRARPDYAALADKARATYDGAQLK